MKKFTIILLSFMFAFALMGANPASAWLINEIVETGEGVTTVVFEVNNDSLENLVGFAIGTNLDITNGGNYYSEKFNPRGVDSSVGDWWSKGTNSELWNDDYNDGVFTAEGVETTFKAYFGLGWVEIFGDYEYAYVAYPDYDYSDDPGIIAAGVNYVGLEAGTADNLDFGFDYYGAGEFFSPAISLFDRSGAFVGETGINNPNPTAPPVPIPSTIALLSLGLLGLAGVSRRKK